MSETGKKIASKIAKNILKSLQFWDNCDIIYKIQILYLILT